MTCRFAVGLASVILVVPGAVAGPAERERVVKELGPPTCEEFANGEWHKSTAPWQEQVRYEMQAALDCLKNGTGSGNGTPCLHYWAAWSVTLKEKSRESAKVQNNLKTFLNKHRCVDKGL
jgi:hypothetical protein